jgi:predicted choloylglycine hydrolase
VGYILQHGCSNVVFRNSDLGPILGKNTDLGMNDSDYLEMKRVYPAEGYAFVAYSYAGTTWAQGLNERGLATGGSSVHPKVKNASATGLSDCILTRLVLQHCATVDEALAFLARHPHVGKGMNFIVMDGTGDAAVVEAAPGHQVAHRIQGDTLFCTNFYVSGKIEMHPETQYLANARARYEIFRRELSGSPALTFDSMKSLLRRHEEPVSVCQHIKDGFNSVLSYIAVPREKALWFTDGHPCEREYERLAL